MSTPMTREELLDTIECLVDGLARALRSLRSGQVPGAPRRIRKGQRSKISLVEDVLRAAGTPLHVGEIIERVRRDHGVSLQRESIVSALTKKVLDGRTFARTGRNQFALRDQGRA